MLPVFTGILRPLISIEKSSTASGPDLRGLADPLDRITFCLIGKLGRNDDAEHWTLVVRDPMRIGGNREPLVWPDRYSVHHGSISVRTTANMKTATAKANATTRTRRCSNFPDALAKKSTVANKTVFARY
jgi:hypothetical protein